MIPYCILVIEDDDDREFMTSLYLDYKQLMYSEVNKIVKNLHDTEDVMQNILEKLIDKIPLLRNRNRNQLINYIISACKFTALNYIRDNKQQWEVPFDEQVDLQDADRDGHEIELRMVKDEELEALRRVLEKMDPRARHLLNGYYFLGKSMAELAKELGMKADNVRMSLTRARRQAFKLLQKDLGTELAGSP